MLQHPPRGFQPSIPYRKHSMPSVASPRLLQGRFRFRILRAVLRVHRGPNSAIRYNNNDKGLLFILAPERSKDFEGAASIQQEEVIA